MLIGVIIKNKTLILKLLEDNNLIISIIRYQKIIFYLFYKMLQKSLLCTVFQKRICYIKYKPLQNIVYVECSL